MLALIHENSILARVRPGDWVDLPDGRRVSPAADGWSCEGYRLATIVTPDPVPEGKRVGSTDALVDGVPTYVLEEFPMPRRMIPKSLVTQRVIDAGKIDQAMAMLQMDWAKFARWVSPDQPAVYFDDPDTVAMVEVLDLDPEAIMAPE